MFAQRFVVIMSPSRSAQDRTHTERLLLRVPQPSDAQDVWRLADNPKVAAMIGTIPSPYPLSAATGWIERVTERRQKGELLAYVICEREAGTLMGVISLNEIRDQTANLAYWLGEPYWGHGYATEAAHQMVRVAFDHLQLDGLTALHLDHNRPSGTILQRIGFHFTHELQREHRGVEHNFRCYALSGPVER